MLAGAGSFERRPGTRPAARGEGYDTGARMMTERQPYRLAATRIARAYAAIGGGAALAG